MGIYKKKRRGIVLAAGIFLAVGLLVLGICFGGNQTAQASGEVVPTAPQARVLTDNGWDIVPIENVVITAASNGLKVMPGQSIDLDVQLTPHYAKLTVQNIEYRFMSGDDLAVIADGKLTVNTMSAKEVNLNVGKEIRVKAVVDGKTSVNTLVFKLVKHCVESVTILNEETQIKQNGSLQLKVKVLPDTAEKNVNFAMTSGNQYAIVTGDGLVRVRDELPAGNLSIKIKVSSASDSTKSVEREFQLYVPTESLELKADRLSPLPNQTVQLSPQISDTATDCIPEYEILEGADYIQSRDGNCLKVVQSISEEISDPIIKIRCKRDGKISNELTIKIHIPTISIVTTATKATIKQGEILQLNAVTVPKNATRTDLEYHIIGGDDNAYATISSASILTAKINPDMQTARVSVYSKIGNIKSDPLEITIERPKIVLKADKESPCVSSKIGDQVVLTVEKDNILQSLDAIEFQIDSGEGYVENLIGGVLRIKADIQVKNPVIQITAVYRGTSDSGEPCEYKSNQRELKIYIPVESIPTKSIKIYSDIDNEEVTEVEQKRGYEFKGELYPKYATKVDEKLKYKIKGIKDEKGNKVDNSAAKISEDGRLSVSEKVPVGATITVEISGPDTITTTHNVTVKTVKATKIQLSQVKNQNGKEVKEADYVYAEDILSFEMLFSEPNNVSASQKDYSVEIDSGDTECASVGTDKKTVIIKPQKQITMENPTFTVKIFSTKNPAAPPVYRTFKVYVSVEKVETTKKDVRIEAGETYAIEDVMTAKIFPQNSNVQSIKYTVECIDRKSDEDAYAWIDDDNQLHIQDKANLNSGNCRFKIWAEAEGKSDAQEFSIYVKTETLEVSVENLTNSEYPNDPMSSKDAGEEIKISTRVDEKATTQTPTFCIEKGAELIEGNYKNGDFIGNQFAVKKDANSILVDGNKIITIVVTQDGKEVKKNFEVVIPTEKAEINDSGREGLPSGEKAFKPLTGVADEKKVFYIQRGVQNTFKLDLTKNAIYKEEKDEDGNVIPRWEVVDKSFAETFEINGNKLVIQVPTNKSKDTEILVKFKSNDRLGKTFEARFIVCALNLKTKDIKFLVDGNIIDTPYDRDSNGIRISSIDPQLYVGRWTVIHPRYNGHELEKYGLTVGGYDPNWASINHHAWISKEDDNTARFQISSDSSGKVSYNPILTILDGDKPYTIDLQEIHAFRPMSGQLKWADGDALITNTTTQLALVVSYDWDMTATYSDKLSDFEFMAGTLNGASVTSDGKLSITSDSASIEQTIKLQYRQKYNDEWIDYLKENGESYQLKKSLKTIKINLGSDCKGDGYILAVDGLFETTTKPTRDDSVNNDYTIKYTFTGYYTTDGNMYYDSDGNIITKYGYSYKDNCNRCHYDNYYFHDKMVPRNHSDFLNVCNIYPRWNQKISYKLNQKSGGLPYDWKYIAIRSFPKIEVESLKNTGCKNLVVSYSAYFYVEGSVTYSIKPYNKTKDDKLVNFEYGPKWDARETFSNSETISLDNVSENDEIELRVYGKKNRAIGDFSVSNLVFDISGV